MSDVLRVSILGSLPNSEVWSVNPVWHLLTNPTPTAAQLITIANTINGLTIPPGLLANLNSATKITGVRLEARTLAGVLDIQHEALRTTAVSGTGAQNHPMQTSVVTSLRTTFPGASGRGRLYWPATGAQLNSASLRIISTDVTASVVAVHFLLDAIEDAITATLGGADLVVWSRKAPAVHAVTELRMGDVPDTQRRRRDQAVETYAAIAYP